MYTPKEPPVCTDSGTGASHPPSLTLVSEDGVCMRSNAGQRCQQSHEHLVVRAVLVVTREPLKLLVNTNKNLWGHEVHSVHSWNTCTVADCLKCLSTFALSVYTCIYV